MEGITSSRNVISNLNSGDTVFVPPQINNYAQLPTSSPSPSSSSHSSFIGAKTGDESSADTVQSSYPENFQSHGWGLMAGVEATNPYAMWIVLLSEFFGVMVWTFGATVIYGLVSDPIAGAIGLAGFTTALYFAYGMWMRPHLGADSIILSFLKKQCGWPLLAIVLIAVIGASFAGVGTGRWIIGHQNFDQHVAFRIKLTSSSTVNDFFKGWFVETIGCAVKLTVASWLRDANMDMAVSGIVMGSVVGATQLFGYGVTGAAYSIERFFAVNIIAADSQFWNIDVLAYLLAWVASLLLVWVMGMIYFWLLGAAKKWANENPKKNQ